ncbi:type II toxin-antitoxin system HipA family toxin [Pseudonocardia sp. TMWB2A]|uniref:type II toxin-antitoxin system HipA family toxin n=1 Tax=Pseudonocardia sp. TMWB2A TaxID=687430 RepID=UPI00307DA50F
MNGPILDRLIVWWGQKIAGELSIDRSCAMHFTYAPEWLTEQNAPPLSWAMPKREEAYGDAMCKAVFGGLLPEEGQRTAIARALGVSPDNPFRLLAALGGDVAGALAFLPTGEHPPLADEGKPAPLDDGALRALLDRLPLVPMLAGEGGARLSLAGAQSKLPVVLAEGRIAVPLPGQPSTHLIKPEPDRFNGLAANEAFCLALAGSVGLDVAEAKWQEVDRRPFLLVTRYDRANKGGEVQRLHQEDFAQALGIPSNRKYAAEGGPVFKDCFALLRAVSVRPAREVLKLLDAAIFNVIIGNADAHAKNFSLLRQDGEGNDIVLAPLYDLVSTVMWKELSPRFAMTFGGAATLEQIDSKHFERFAADAGLAAPFVKRRAGQLAAVVSNTIDRGIDVPGLNEPDALTMVHSTIADRAERFALKAGGRTA